MALAFPEFTVTQDMALEVAAMMAPRWAARQSLRNVYLNARIDQRHVVLPPKRTVNA
ncbi:hypothetical protein [Deinococcus cavernae]|uniref:hypothetical protein n=1 Tax=Deinococcus cavernae TaxID=2320857 RepID=UPI0013144864|nr:hypothetical protein [Deinococcus cavernae]